MPSSLEEKSVVPLKSTKILRNPGRIIQDSAQKGDHSKKVVYKNRSIISEAVGIEKGNGSCDYQVKKKGDNGD